MEKSDPIFYYSKTESQITRFTGWVLEGMWGGICRLLPCLLVLPKVEDLVEGGQTINL